MQMVSNQPLLRYEDLLVVEKQLGYVFDHHMPGSASMHVLHSVDNHAVQA